MSDAFTPEVLFDRLRILRLPQNEFAVFGSGLIAARGLLPTLGDLDILVRGEAWSRVKKLGTIVMYGTDEVIDLGNGLTFGRSWAYGSFDVDDLIENAETIDGLPLYDYQPSLSSNGLRGDPRTSITSAS